MIKGITSSSPFITISGGNPVNTYISPGASGAGMLRYNTNSNSIEVNDGNNWKELSTSYASVDLNYEAQELLNWARTERSKQFAREAKIKNNPALQKAYDAIKRAEENFDLLEAIAGNYQSEDEVQAGP